MEEKFARQEDRMHARPCRACVDLSAMFKKSKLDNSKHGTSKKSDSASTASVECPVDASELGRNTWSFLHTMAAYYPEKPNQQQQTEMKQFINTFSKYYPCDVCAEDLREKLKTDQPDTTSRYNFSQWMCRLHNDVNKKLGKPQFDCRRVDERWKDGWADGSCDY